MASSGDIPTVTRLLINQRSGGCCEWCGRPAHQIHHRRPRGMGGTALKSIHRASNLLHLCNDCHAWIESHRDEARGFGLLLGPLDDPTAVRVGINRYRGLPCYLTDDGMFTLGELCD